MKEADKKNNELSNKINAIAGFEKRLVDLNLLAEDANVKIKNLKEEEDTINQAGDKIAELKFLLGKIEKQ
jgi:hypothetical protein